MTKSNEVWIFFFFFSCHTINGGAMNLIIFGGGLKCDIKLFYIYYMLSYGY